MLESVLPFSNESSWNFDVFMSGVKRVYLEHHHIWCICRKDWGGLESVSGVSIILGSDLAGEVFPPLEGVATNDSISMRVSTLVEQKNRDTDNVIQTPDHKRKSRLCQYAWTLLFQGEHPSAASCCTNSATPPQYHLAEDGSTEKNSSMSVTLLRNSKALSNLESLLAHLAFSWFRIICRFSSHHPRQTVVLFHDIDIKGHKPMKQHAYKVNPTKRTMMQKEVSYPTEHRLAKTRFSKSAPGALPVCYSENLTIPLVSALTTEKSAPSQNLIHFHSLEWRIDSVGSAKSVIKLYLLKGYWPRSLNVTGIRNIRFHNTW